MGLKEIEDYVTRRREAESSDLGKSNERKPSLSNDELEDVSGDDIGMVAYKKGRRDALARTKKLREAVALSRRIKATLAE